MSIGICIEKHNSQSKNQIETKWASSSSGYHREILDFITQIYMAFGGVARWLTASVTFLT